MVTSPDQILIVDDEESIRFSLSEILTRDGYQVTTADSGEAALERFSRQQFDLMLLDLKMGGMGGIQVLSALRRQGLDTAVIVLTAHGTMDSAIEALRQGAHDFVIKPCNTADLRESVRTALQKRCRDRRQRALLVQMEKQLTDSLEEIRAAVLPPSLLLPVATSPETPPAGLTIDVEQHVIRLDGHPLNLSPTEFDVLAHLVACAPNVVKPVELVRAVLGYTADRFQAAEIARHYVYRIRQAARCAAGRDDVVRTVRGVGYALGG